jgi:hypothetical protein
MNNILICADGGASGNFIGTLIRLFKNPRHFGDFNLSIPQDGCVDTLSAAAAMQEYTVKHLGVNIYPERGEGADIICTALSTVDLTPYGWREFANDVQLNVIHYVRPDHIDRFLTLDNVSVILVRTKSTDADQVAINKLSKNFFLSKEGLELSLKDLDLSKRHLSEQLIENKFIDSAEHVKSAESLENLPRQVKMDLMQSWGNHVRRRSAIPLPNLHERLLTIYFDEIMNQRDIVIDKIGKFVGCSTNDNLLQFYNEYLSKQPTVESYLNC